MSALKAAVRARLAELARDGRTISYKDLADEVGVPPPQRIHALTLVLEDLAREDHAAGRPLLAACAVGRASGGIPGPGFFHVLAELGRYHGPDRGPEAAAAHAAELQAAFDHWGRRAPGG